jgi:hypothetical protein
MRIHNHLTKAALAVATIVGAVGVIASPASAFTTSEVDSFTIDGTGYDLGGPFWEDGAPTGHAVVRWEKAWWGATVPRVLATIHLKNAGGDCARARVIAYDSSGAEIGRDFSDTECASDNSLQSFDVDERGQSGAASVKVTLQSLTDLGWTAVGSRTLTHGPTVDTDDVTINRATFDFGSGAFTGGNPAEPGTLTWTVSGQGTIATRLTGKLYINDTDTCARMRMGFYALDGTYLTSKHGGTVCGVNDELRQYNVNLAPYSHSQLVEVRVSIQQFDASPPPGEWVQVGASTELLN